MSYTLNGGAGQPIALQSFGSMSVFPPMMGPPISLLLDSGDNTVCVRSADAQGDQISNSCFTVVWMPVGITSEAASPTSGYTLTGQASADVASLTYSLNGAAPQDVVLETDGSFSVPLLLGPGTNNICMTATDGPGATGNTLVAFCYGVAYLPVAVTSPTHSRPMPPTGTTGSRFSTKNQPLQRFVPAAARHRPRIHACHPVWHRHQGNIHTRTWPNFARTVWNHGSVVEIGKAHFREWDDIQKAPFKGDVLNPPGQSLEQYEATVNNRQVLNADLEPFSARYYHFTFCRDKADGRIEELVLVFSAGDLSNE